MALRWHRPLALVACILLCVAAAPARAAPDLQVEIVGIEAGPPSTITVLVRNLGDSNARATKVGIVLDAGVARTGVKAPTRRLKAGDSATLEVPVLVVPGLKVQAIIDPENSIEEGDEENNSSAVWLVERAGRDFVLVPLEPGAEAEVAEAEEAEEVTEPEDPAEPDDSEADEATDEMTEPPAVAEIRPPPLLPLADLVLQVLEVEPGTGGSITLRIDNRGLLAAPRSHVVLYLASGGRRSEVEAVVPALDSRGRAVVEIPADLPGQARFEVRADARDEILESDESNNRTPVQTVPGEPPAETVATAIDLSAKIVRVDPGPPLRVRVRIENLGSLSSAATLVTLTLGAGQSLVEEVPPLKPGQSIEVVFQAGTPDELVVMVDPAQAIAESDESNNRSEAALPATPATPAPQGRTTWMLGDTAVLIEPAILGEQRTVPGHLPGAPVRPLAALLLADGSRVVFVENQLLFHGSEAEAVALAKRSGGKILRSVARPATTGRPPTWFIAVGGGTAALPSTGTAEAAPVLVSSLQALNLLSLVMRERAAGHSVSIDPLLEPLDAFTGVTLEAKGSNSSDWSYMKKGAPLDVNVVGAWQLLQIAGRAPHSVKVALLDSGFSLQPDLPPSGGTTGPYDSAETLIAAPVHGTNVASALAGLADNGVGAAGPAGAYVNLLFLGRSFTAGDAIAGLWEASAKGASIVNMSFGTLYPRNRESFGAAWNDSLVAFEEDAAFLFEQGILLFAAAGNGGSSVDALDANGDERAWMHPCESRGVICVGGWGDDAGRAPDSNYGEGRGETVDIYGPYAMKLGPDPLFPDADAQQDAAGTSLSSPFVAGIAALVWAANPSLTNRQVWDLLRSNVTPGKDGIPLVNAYRPVRQALLAPGESFPPHVEILSPAGFAAVSQSVPLTLRAQALDLEDGDDCCTLIWESDLDGPLGSGPSLELSFAGRPVGTRIVTVTATDSAGLSGQASTAIDYSN